MRSVAAAELGHHPKEHHREGLVVVQGGSWNHMAATASSLFSSQPLAPSHSPSPRTSSHSRQLRSCRPLASSAHPPAPCQQGSAEQKPTQCCQPPLTEAWSQTPPLQPWLPPSITPKLLALTQLCSEGLSHALPLGLVPLSLLPNCLHDQVHDVQQHSASSRRSEDG